MHKTTCSTTVGVFESKSAAERAVKDLKADGFKDEDIGMIWKDNKGEAHRTDGSGATRAERDVAKGATIGVAAGAAAGAGATAAILTGIIPPLGPVVALGILGTTLLNAAGAAAAGGLAGALIGWGVSEDDAKFYENQVAAGNYLVTVKCGSKVDTTNSIYARHGGTYRTPADSPALKV